MVARVCGRLRQQTRLNAVALSGGVFQNALLATQAAARLTRDGFDVYRHRRVPPNDGGLSLGQLAMAAAADEAVLGLGESSQSDGVPEQGVVDVSCIPGKVVETYREHDVLMGKVDFGGVFKRVCLEHVPEASSRAITCWFTSASRCRGSTRTRRMRVFEFLER